jgi:hypothetical protein
MTCTMHMIYVSMEIILNAIIRFESSCWKKTDEHFILDKGEHWNEQAGFGEVNEALSGRVAD